MDVLAALSRQKLAAIFEKKRFISPPSARGYTTKGTYLQYFLGFTGLSHEY
jgi:hypothetical protein